MTSEVHGVSKRPFIFSVECCIAADDSDAASRLWCSLNDLLESIPGVFPRGGYFGPMSEDDIIPDSPLANALNGL